MAYLAKVSQPLLREMGRNLWVRLIARLLNELPLRADSFRQNRDPQFVSCFRYPLVFVVLDQNVWYDFSFAVDDRHAPALYIVGYSRVIRPINEVSRPLRPRVRE